MNKIYQTIGVITENKLLRDLIWDLSLLLILAIFGVLVFFIFKKFINIFLVRITAKSKNKIDDLIIKNKLVPSTKYLTEINTHT